MRLLMCDCHYAISFCSILMSEAYTNLPNTLRFYGKVENNKITQYGAQIPFNFELISKTSKTSTAFDFKANIENWINGMPKGKGIEANWAVSIYNYLATVATNPNKRQIKHDTRSIYFVAWKS